MCTVLLHARVNSISGIGNRVIESGRGKQGIERIVSQI